MSGHSPPPAAMPELPLRPMSESVAMHWLGLVLMSVAHISTREHGDVSSRGVHGGPHEYPEVVHNWPFTSLAVVLWTADLVSDHWQH